MANRVIPVETKVKVMQECLRLVDVEDVAARRGVSPGRSMGGIPRAGKSIPKQIGPARPT
ncbi:hypothetical protein EKD04_024360 [Chloroflexales bacterium ZM16-3]|nr:hypothetical protein [Chloroflexales bacterium ZM16-3]